MGRKEDNEMEQIQKGLESFLEREITAGDGRERDGGGRRREPQLYNLEEDWDSQPEEDWDRVPTRGGRRGQSGKRRSTAGRVPEDSNRKGEEVGKRQDGIPGREEAPRRRKTKEQDPGNSREKDNLKGTEKTPRRRERQKRAGAESGEGNPDCAGYWFSWFF